MMVRLDAQNVPAKKIGLLFFAASILIQHGTSGQRVKVDAELPSYPGQTVNLRCSFSDPTGIQLTMVSWRYEANDGKSMNIAVYHPSYGPNYPASPLKDRVHFKPDPPELSSPSIEITDVKMTDEGKYICEYATYPDGNDQGTTKLVMLAKPENSASVVRVNADTQEVVVARCESKDGRPEAKIRWVTTANGNSTEKSQKGADDTVTVTSEYRMVPTSMDNGKDITCLVDHRTQIKPESFPMKLAIQFPPKVEIKGYDNNWYVGRTNAVLICEATGNPLPVSVTWRTMSGEMPDTVQVLSNKLKVLKVDDSVNTTFICEVKNRIGTTRDQLAIFVRATRLPMKGAATGSIIGSIIGVILLLALIGTGIALYRKQKAKKLAEGPPRYKPPPPKKNNSSANRPMMSSNVPVTEDRRLQSQYYSTQSQEPITDLDGYQEEDVDCLEDHDGEHYFSVTPSGWDDPGNNEVPSAYMETNVEPQDDNGGLHISRAESFVSSAMIV
ncbi:nectin-2-like isoform X2 [Girardinichthys multiradiatus]|uniref:nectin-2-like isoform X2 n=1 Tax=Girardinichthys multiradiatus TaxID=208333 RepID=UPI001FAC6ACB|nr:nectin-2-like isoform X2 [Girardinichthys multiradiatus]